MAHKSSLRRIFGQCSAQGNQRGAHLAPGSFALSAATSYYMPEGRYYEAPLILKKKPTNSKRVLLFSLFGVGFSLASVSSLQQHTRVPFVAANTTVVLRDDTNRNHKKTSIHKTRAPLMVATHRRQHPPLVALAMQMEAKPYHIAGLIRANPPPSPAIDTTQWLASIEDFSQKWIPVLREKMQQTQILERLTKPREVTEVKIALAPIARQWASNVTTHIDHWAQVMSAAADSIKMNEESKSEQDPVIAQIDPVAKQTAPTLPALHEPNIAHIPLPKKKELPVLLVPKMLASLVNNDTPDILALGYAPALSTGTTPFDSILTKEDKNKGRFIPPIGAKDHAWAANPLPPLVFSDKEQKCLAEAIYFESRGEKLKGQAAVAQVVLNRVRNPAYPTTICGVVYQNASWRNRCQFSFACDGKRRKVTDVKHWQVAQDVAKAVTAGQIWLPEIGSSTHYHAVYVRPRWARSMYKLEKIGLHIFYRTKGGGWS